MTSTPIYHAAFQNWILQPRPRIATATEFGNPSAFWVEYPSGLVDLTRSAHLPLAAAAHADASTPADPVHEDPAPPPPLAEETQFELPVDGDRTLRLNRATTALVVVDMQNYFLHPDLREHPTGLDCVIPLMNAVPALRALGVKILWVNWGLTDHELTTLPPALVRGFMRNGKGGFGAPLPPPFGRLLMRGSYNAQLYGPLQHLYEEGASRGTDAWVHKNRMSALWGPQTALDLLLQESGITSLLIAGVNADQCVLGTLVDAYYRGYDVVVLKDCIATTSPVGGLENVLYNSANSYGFVTDSVKVKEAAREHAGHH
ncbi:hypothetical protein EIP86_004462 [Pleurotus ostreatoroseus]|nr:hypothetical protein EIP86_004462 [Pleurotus ostreatoroseus]